MDSIRSTLVATLLNEDKLMAIHWLTSFAFFVNLIVITIKSVLTRIVSKQKVSSVKDCYYIRGLLVYQMLCYGLLLVLLIYYWYLDGSYIRELYYLANRITVLEAACECIFYYSGIILYDYNLLILLSFMAEAIIQVVGNYDALKGIRIALILIMVIEGKIQAKNGLFGKWMILLIGAMLFPIIPMVMSALCK